MAKKHNDDASPSEKILGLYGLLLFTGRKYNLSSLADKFDCSKQTILRMVETIERTHTLPLMTEMENGRRWYWIEAPKESMNVFLKAEDIRYLNMCKDMVSDILPQGIKHEIEQALISAESFVPSSTEPTKHKTTSFFSNDRGVINYDKFQDEISLLLECIENNEICQISYTRAGATEPQSRYFAADKIHSRNATLYVEGWKLHEHPPHEIKHEQTLAIHRIQEITTTGFQFNFGAKEREPLSYFGFDIEDPFEVKIRVNKSTAPYIRERQWSADQHIEQQQDGGVILTLSAQSYHEVTAWILSLGNDVELLEPQGLRKHLFETTQKMNKKYSPS